MSSFSVNATFRGESVPLDGCDTSMTSLGLHGKVRDAFSLSDETQIKILLKGKMLPADGDASPVFASVPKKAPKVIVMATSTVVVREIESKRSDPTIRGFDQEKQRSENAKIRKALHWGPGTTQLKEFKFCRFQACSWQSFGHRPAEKTPHAFKAMQLLEKLATDPGIVAIMGERELVVGTLGEMDPIDDRIMKRMQEGHKGSHLLGYNTNAGARIDIKLRTDDLQDFRPYPELASTLIHELSHNWVGEHDLLFWTNFAQMRAEYLTTHRALRGSVIVDGKTTADLAGLDKARLENVFDFVMWELQGEMAQHGLNPSMIEAPIRQRCRELEEQASKAGRRLGGEREGGGNGQASGAGRSARERALAAAERRRAEGRKDSER